MRNIALHARSARPTKTEVQRNLLIWRLHNNESSLHAHARMKERDRLELTVS